MRIRTPLLAVVATGLLTASLAGCGARDESTTESSAASPCTGSSSADAADPSELTLALVPSGDANKLVETVKPLQDALTERLGIPVRGVITQDYQAAVEAIGANQAQIGMLPPLQMVQACNKYGAEPALQTVRKGKTTYAAQFYTNNPDKYCDDAPVTGANGLLYCNGTESGTGPAGLDSLSKMNGAKTVMLQSASSAGFVFPSAALKEAGIDSTTDLDLTQVTSHPAAVLSVNNGDDEVGVSFWDARETVVADTPDVAKNLVVFALTNEIPNDGVSISSSLSPDLQQRISDAMEDYASTPEGVEALTAIYQITGLDKADPAALQQAQTEADTIGLGN
ncbi:phosphate ABC transporter substrate-binding protein [Rhodococcus sp. 06-470-2]|uniref:phosphate/phosphite/phosphonate ABC transporter substrate-binding protein n=1 Tax=unclassified Rhodococcus (in: high G+C Gram-positive bacteria) TaxID=192944 RepID=UPI000B9BC5E5|nr:MULTISPECIES: phosphate/phosphite/phosphonate ABC transporter substrate-binding protein [unclassified Rhodococcus (in: high G+C Gram-positive bacteria)]OZC58973.1 phosphate ABC transporter substrate-binding protein [Rhodococcus sp. 06-470-2]OZE66561.1 phosphate ABC transporter substrate-binding protein [Rhodococcus sp. 05-2221-1B]